METILFTKKDLSSGIELPGDVEKVLSFIADWGKDYELALWFDNYYVYIYQPGCDCWSLYEVMKFNSDIVAANIVADFYCGLFSSETIRRPSCDYNEHVVALCIRRYYIQ